jgi:hypothetical protein
MEHVLEEEFLLWASWEKFSIGGLVDGHFYTENWDQMEPNCSCIQCSVSVSHFGSISDRQFSLCTKLSHQKKSEL